MKNFAVLAIAASALLVSCATEKDTIKSRLNLIKKRNELICGISGKIPGFSYMKSDGSFSGLDVDICKAFAAAFTGNANNVRYRTLTAAERFTALRTGEVDLISRNTTFNLSRDSIQGNGLTFAPVVFHDGQGLMVKKDSQIKKIEDLASKSICVGSGTTTEQNINDVFESRGLSYSPIKYQELNQVIAGYIQGRCSAMTSDRSQLAAAKLSFQDPSNHIILDDILSKEPLAPASLGNDQELSDAMRWTIYSLITAEEYGITKDNVDDILNLATNNNGLKNIRRLLGIEGNLGNKIGLDNNFVYNILKSVGNYGEIYDRNLGPKAKIKIPRGQNKLFKNGGLVSSPPFN